jgi:transcriptional regulator with PAS, ATPase and Fis domain
MRVGSSKVQKVDIRIIAATNRDLSKDIAEGKFRQDLYYRLNVAKLEVPPLRERHEDILLLARHFLDIYNTKYKKKMRLAPEVDPVFTLYPWPGNIRELQNLMQQLVIITEDEVIGLGDLPPRLYEYAKMPEAQPRRPVRHMPLPDTPKALKDTMAEIEHGILTEALKQYGSCTRVAEIFQIDRSTLFRKLRRFNPDFTEEAS